MSGIKRRRRQRAARYTLLMLGLAAIGLVYAAVTGAGSAASAATPGAPSPADIAQGKAIFADTCSSCHGMNAQGKQRARTLEQVLTGSSETVRQAPLFN